MTATQQNSNIIQDIENQKIKNIKYKIYIFLIILCMYIFWATFMGTFETASSLQDNLSSIRNKVDVLNIKIQEGKTINDTITLAEQKRNETIDCINDVSCKKTSTIDNFDSKRTILRTYFQLSKFDQDKMDYNQKLILQNIDGFLLKTNFNQYNGNVSIISFGVPVEVDLDRNLYKLPISLNIDFSDKNSLLFFLDNIENKLSKESNVYYTIDSLNYNVANYSANQTVTMNINAYFYK